MWLSRSRPDIAYAVGVMSRLMHRRPAAVVQWGGHLMRYLNDTVEHKLWYRSMTRQAGGDDHLPRHWGESTLEVSARNIPTAVRKSVVMGEQPSSLRDPVDC